MQSNEDYKEQEEMFVTQAAHLLLALAGIKPLPTKSSGKPVKTSLDALELSQS
jgi:hypothetical protein